MFFYINCLRLMIMKHETMLWLIMEKSVIFTQTEIYINYYILTSTEKYEICMHCIYFSAFVWWGCTRSFACTCLSVCVNECVHVCVYACVPVCMNVCLTRRRECAGMNTCARVRVCVFVCLRLCLCVCLCGGSVQAWICVWAMCVWACVCLCAYVRVCAVMCAPVASRAYFIANLLCDSAVRLHAAH